MPKTHTFKFVDNDLNDKLITLLSKKAKGRYTIDKKGFVHYSHEHEELIGNELICRIRTGVFLSWQVIGFPPEWKDSYEAYMTKHRISFRAEMRDGTLRFLIPRRYHPNSWKLEEPWNSRQSQSRSAL